MTEWADATELAARVRGGELRAIDVVEEATTEIESQNQALNAVIRPMFDQARNIAIRNEISGPFAGVPMVVKDLVAEVAGEPFHEGMAYLRDLGYRAPADQALVRTIRRCWTVGPRSLSSESSSSPPSIGRCDVFDLAETRPAERNARPTSHHRRIAFP